MGWTEEKGEGSKDKSGGAQKAKQQNVLAGLEIQNKLTLEQDKYLQMKTHQSGNFLFVLNGQQNERVILKFTGKASQGRYALLTKSLEETPPTQVRASSICSRWPSIFPDLLTQRYLLISMLF